MKRSTTFYKMADGRLLTDSDLERMATEMDRIDLDRCGAEVAAHGSASHATPSASRSKPSGSPTCDM